MGTTRPASSSVDTDTGMPMLSMTTRDASSPHTASPRIERWHTEWRERVVTRTDTVYQDREVRIQLPPERYVPRAVKGLAWAGGAAIFSICLWLILKMCKFVNWKICK